jgi:hypothetical protein
MDHALRLLESLGPLVLQLRPVLPNRQHPLDKGPAAQDALIGEAPGRSLPNKGGVLKHILEYLQHSESRRGPITQEIIKLFLHLRPPSFGPGRPGIWDAARSRAPSRGRGCRSQIPDEVRKGIEARLPRHGRECMP